MFDLKKRYLNCLDVAWVPMLAQIGASLLHLFWCWLFVTKCQLEVFGLGVAMVITNMSMLFMTEVYSCCVPRIKESIFCPDKHTCNGWAEYLRLGIPATIMLCAEFWAFEILIFLAGVLGVEQIAACVIFF